MGDTINGVGYQWANVVLPASVTNTPINAPSLPQVDYKRTEYNESFIKWVLIDDVVAGQHRIKEKGTVYLPMPTSSNDETENKKRYLFYLQRAVFFNVVRRTLAGLVGEVFATDPVLNVPPELELIELDVDGGGVTLNQQARVCLTRVIALGRTGLYVDYPQANGTTTRADELKGLVRPVIYCCHPADVINWRIELIGSRRLLSLVVITESYVVQDDGFKETTSMQLRCLRLKLGTNADGSVGTNLIYYQQIYRKDGSGNWVQFGQDIIPTDYNGQPFQEILFTFVGSDSNDPGVSDPPMYDMCVINIAHYRNSADYEEMLFMLGNPTPYVSGLSKQWVDTVLKGTIMLGARAIIPLPEGASAGLLEMTGNSQILEAMTNKQEQMTAIGAKLIANVSTTKTATQDYRESSEDSSVLASCAVNVSTAYSQALNWCAQFVMADPKMPPMAQAPAPVPSPAPAADDETTPPAVKVPPTPAPVPPPVEDEVIEYVLNTDFSSAIISPAERMQLMKEWQGGAITWKEYRFRLHRAGVAYENDDAALAEIDAIEKTEQALQQAAALQIAQTVQRNNPIDSQVSNGGNI